MCIITHSKYSCEHPQEQVTRQKCAVMIELERTVAQFERDGRQFDVERAVAATQHCADHTVHRTRDLDLCEECMRALDEEMEQIFGRW